MAHDIPHCCLMCFLDTRCMTDVHFYLADNVFLILNLSCTHNIAQVVCQNVSMLPYTL